MRSDANCTAQHAKAYARHTPNRPCEEIPSESEVFAMRTYMVMLAPLEALLETVECIVALGNVVHGLLSTVHGSMRLLFTYTVVPSMSTPACIVMPPRTSQA